MNCFQTEVRMGKKENQGDITNKVIFHMTVYFLFSIAFIAAGEFAGWVGAFIVAIAFCVWAFIITEIRKKAGTFFL